MDMSIVASPLVLWSLCIKQHTGFSAVLNFDIEQLNVCSSCKTTLSSQHSTDCRETAAPVAWVESLCLKLQTVLVFLLCSTTTMHGSIFVQLVKQLCHHNTQLTDVKQLHL